MWPFPSKPTASVAQGEPPATVTKNVSQSHMDYVHIGLLKASFNFKSLSFILLLNIVLQQNQVTKREEHEFLLQVVNQFWR